jgi:hypothetical protein
VQAQSTPYGKKGVQGNAPAGGLGVSPKIPPFPDRLVEATPGLPQQATIGYNRVTECKLRFRLIVKAANVTV